MKGKEKKTMKSDCEENLEECTQNCDCEENLTEHFEHDCGCEEDENCTCGEGCDCGDECECEDERCHCHDDEFCSDKHEHKHHHSHENEYLLLAQRLQADFENYRKRVSEQLERERQEGVESVIEVFLPCLDTFKEAKKSIMDETILSGVNMIEDKIMEALKSLNVEKITSIGEKFDPHLHNVIAAMRDETKEDGLILEEYQAGWTHNGKVIRYSKVVVNKLS